MSFKRDEYDSAESVVDLDFVDYGDCEEKKITEVFQIKTDFLKLKLQAVRCSLAHVRYYSTVVLLSYEQCCGSGMFIPDPKTATKERGEKNLLS